MIVGEHNSASSAEAPVPYSSVFLAEQKREAPLNAVIKPLFPPFNLGAFP
jgi:hypothetical protein